MTKLRKFQFGFCTSDNHSYCRGALHQPPDDEGHEQIQYCSCKCHEGQEVAPPEKVVKALPKGSWDLEERDRWSSELVAYRKIVIDTPDDDAMCTTKMNRMRNAGKKAGLKVQIRNREGKITCKVVK